MFETRSQAWSEAGLLRQVSPGAVRKARWEAVLLVPLFVGVVVLYENRHSLLGLSEAGNGDLSWLETPVRIATVIALLILGWAIARDIGRALGPAMFRRMDPAMAGTVGFVVRLVTVAVAFVVALSVAGVDPRTLALGGAFTAVIVGLAAQQTLGNVIAGTVLLSARPFRVGDPVRLQGGQIAGQIEGTISSLGLLYTTFATEDGSILVPNSVVLSVAVLAKERRPREKDPRA
jgi:small-conductance mechanosensitive channel